MTDTTWTERYLAAVLRSIPESRRGDVERELRSSIEDGIEERVANGEDRVAAERAVLEGLGDPGRLAAAYTGRPNYLIGPALFPVYSHIIPRLIAISAPIVLIAVSALKIIAGTEYLGALAAGTSATIGVVIQLAFWGTLFFVFLERADAARETREQIASAVGTWTVDRLPEPSNKRVSVSETVGEVLTVLITAGGLLFVRSLEVNTPTGRIPLLDPSLLDVFVPYLAGVLVVLGAVHLLVYVVGHWTYPLATVHGILAIAWGAPIAYVALQGQLVNPAFASAIGWPGLAAGDQPAMLAIAVGVTLVTAWEVFDAFRRARGASLAGFASAILSRGA
ncbi:MAG TPA: permease prefix domain 1-containing protein [Candidatus Binatia bacterium]|nr:permease prefix domain 1-containing protein [Candidatus Binatia bacterium]